MLFFDAVRSESNFQMSEIKHAAEASTFHLDAYFWSALYLFLQRIDITEHDLCQVLVDFPHPGFLSGAGYGYTKAYKYNTITIT